MYRLRQIIALPTTDEKNVIFKCADHPDMTTVGLMWETRNFEQKLLHEAQSTYHLYAISDEKLKDGDLTLCLDELDTTVMNWKLNQAIGNWNKDNSCTSCRKIIATTDSELTVTVTTPRVFMGDIECKLPTFPIPFLNGYCRRGGIDEVMVEYEVTNRCCGRCDGVHDLCLADMVCDDHKEMGCPKCYGSRGDVITLKLNSNNEIIVEPARDNWNREELDVILSNLTNDVYNTFRNTKHATFNLDDWKNENLK